MAIYSLHVGLTHVSAKTYPGVSQLKPLPASIVSAKNLRDVLVDRIDPHAICVVHENPTVSAVKKSLSQMALQAKKGDLVIFHYVGHGAQTTIEKKVSSVPHTGVDVTQDPFPNDFECTIILKDRMMVSAEIHNCYAAFKKGVRILNLIDSCDSGLFFVCSEPFGTPDFTREIDEFNLLKKKLYPNLPNPDSNTDIPSVFATLTALHPKLYKRLEYEKRKKIKGTGVHFSSCRAGDVGMQHENPDYSDFTFGLVFVLEQGHKHEPLTYEQIRTKTAAKVSSLPEFKKYIGKSKPVLLPFGESTKATLKTAPFEAY